VCFLHHHQQETRLAAQLSVVPREFVLIHRLKVALPAAHAVLDRRILQQCSWKPALDSNGRILQRRFNMLGVCKVV
jgi:hypothetical protein